MAVLIFKIVISSQQSNVHFYIFLQDFLDKPFLVVVRHMGNQKELPLKHKKLTWFLHLDVLQVNPSRCCQTRKLNGNAFLRFLIGFMVEEAKFYFWLLRHLFLSVFLMTWLMDPNTSSSFGSSCKNGGARITDCLQLSL